MKRWLVVASVAMGLGMVACGSSEKKDTGGDTTFTPAPDAQAIVGSWGNSEATVTFDGNGHFKWEKMIPCGAPPCPTTMTDGTYTLANGKVIMDPTEGNDMSMSYSWGGNQTSLMLDAKTYSKK